MMSDTVIDRLEAAFRSFEGIVVTRSWLAVYVWREALADDSRAIDVAVGAARRRLQPGERIESVPGIGYKLTVPSAASIVASKIEASGERLIRDNAAWLREMADK